MFKGEAVQVGKQDALQALTEAILSHGTELQEGTLTQQLDTCLECLQLFSAGTMLREQFVRGLQQYAQLYQQLSLDNTTATTERDALVLPHSFQLQILHLIRMHIS